MKVIKFGSSAVATAQKIKEVAQLALNRKGEGDIIVLSSISGTTDTLREIADYLYKKNTDGAKELTNVLERNLLNLCKELFSEGIRLAQISIELRSRFDKMRSMSQDIFTLFEEKQIIAQGDILSTLIFTEYLKSQQVDVKYIDALSFMRIDKNEDPDTAFIKKNLKAKIEEAGKADLYTTEGFICLNAYNEIDNLKQGGSDYTASLIGAAMKAEEIQIWSDKNAICNIDETIVDGAKPVQKLNFEEAEELAYFSAKALHPTCLAPAKLENIAVRLMNSQSPEADGTLISTDYIPNKIEVIAAKDGITSIRIKSSRMLFAHGFLRRVFEVFEQYKTSIDMITTSEVGVAVTIDNNKNLDEIVDILKKFGTVTVSKDMTIICAVGDLSEKNVSLRKELLSSLEDTQVSMISYGASGNNISVLIPTSEKAKAMSELKKNIF